jgi:four helix bundle protein
MFLFEKFEAWKRAIDLADELMEFSVRIPQIYQRSLGDQLRRSSLSIPTNLAEGTGRNSIRERIHFYGIARGSLFECVNLLIMARKRQLIHPDLHQRLYREATEISSMINAVISAANR